MRWSIGGNQGETEASDSAVFFEKGRGLSLTQRLRLSSLNRLLISLMTWLAIVSIGLLVTLITLKPPLRKTLRAASTSS